MQIIMAVGTKIQYAFYSMCVCIFVFVSQHFLYESVVYKNKNLVSNTYVKNSRPAALTE